MFFKKCLRTLALVLVIMPLNTLAIPTSLIAGGENIGIQISLNGVAIAGTYEINGKNPAIDAGLKVGDVITSINGTKINSIDGMVNIINNSNSKVEIGFMRKEKSMKTNLELINVDGVIKTGLYVKDSITGIGTLSFIDPDTKKFGALGHEITSKNTNYLLEIKDGKIFESSVTTIDRSEAGTPGAKNANFYTNNVLGNVSINTTKGIFGIYTDTLQNKKEYKVADNDEIELGSAKILTVTSGNEVKEYSINILKLNNDNSTNKNILFEITDEELLSLTGGVVQGMSGSPIIQNDYIVGVVNYVIVDSPERGYGVFITNMLEEMESE